MRMDLTKEVVSELADRAEKLADWIEDEEKSEAQGEAPTKVLPKAYTVLYSAFLIAPYYLHMIEPFGGSWGGEGGCCAPA